MIRAGSHLSRGERLRVVSQLSATPIRRFSFSNRNNKPGYGCRPARATPKGSAAHISAGSHPLGRSDRLGRRRATRYNPLHVAAKHALRVRTLRDFSVVGARPCLARLAGRRGARTPSSSLLGVQHPRARDRWTDDRTRDTRASFHRDGGSFRARHSVPMVALDRHHGCRAGGAASPEPSRLLPADGFAIGVWLYARTTRATDRAGSLGFWALVAFLSLIYLGNVFGEPPPNVTALAWVAQAQWLVVAWGYWLDRHRVAS